MILKARRMIITTTAMKYRREQPPHSHMIFMPLGHHKPMSGSTKMSSLVDLKIILYYYMGIYPAFLCHLSSDILIDISRSYVFAFCWMIFII